jgi:chaperonin GroES
MDVKVDDTVVYAKDTGTVVKLGGKELLILKETEVLAVVELQGSSWTRN